MRLRRLASSLPALLMLAALRAQAVGAPVPDTLAQRALPCTTCHSGGADSPSAPARGAYIPRIAGKPAGYLKQQLLNFREGRRKHDAMARLLENLSDSYLDELAQHFSSLALPYPPPPAGARDHLATASAQRAERWIYAGDSQLGIPACASCHGQALTGIAPRVPGLLGLPGSYLSAQLGAWRVGVRQARAPDCMAQIAKRLPQEAIADIARWLEAQPVPASAVAITTTTASHPPSAHAAAGTPPTRWPMPCGSLAP